MALDWQTGELSWSPVVKQHMTNQYFNALEYAQQLERAGLSAAQAEVQANALARALSSVTSAADIASLKESVSDLKARIDRLETRLNWMAGIIMTAQFGLFAMVAGLYLR